MSTSKESKEQAGKPDYVVDLEKAYGAPSQEGFGSAVFFEQLDEKADLEEVAKKYYEHFVGKKWQEQGEETWMDPWKEVYVRPAKAKADIEKELTGIKDFMVQMQVDMILNNIEEAAAAKKALSTAYDAADVVDLRAYYIGDGDAMSGILLAGKRENGDATFLTFLYD